MACVEWQDEMAKIKIKEQKLQKVEGKGFFFIFYLKTVWVYLEIRIASTQKIVGKKYRAIACVVYKQADRQRKFLQGKLCHSDKLGEVTSFPRKLDGMVTWVPD